MPNRILREAILDSEAVNSLTGHAELFYRRLMSVVDDFGRFDARPAVLRSRLYPLRIETVREADISRWIAECEKAGLIALYEVGGRHYLLFHKLGEPRAKTSKFPPPPCQSAKESVVAVVPANQESSPESGGVGGGARTCAQTPADETGREQPRADAPYSLSGSPTLDPPYPPPGEPAPVIEPPTPAKSLPPRPPQSPTPEEFEAAWNALPPPFPRIRQMSPERCRALKTRRADAWWRENWRKALAMMPSCAFLAGGNDRGWVADVDFFLRGKTVTKIMEGSYKADRSPIATPESPEAHAARTRGSVEAALRVGRTVAPPHPALAAKFAEEGTP